MSHCPKEIRDLWLPSLLAGPFHHFDICWFRKSDGIKGMSNFERRHGRRQEILGVSPLPLKCRKNLYWEECRTHTQTPILKKFIWEECRTHTQNPNPIELINWFGYLFNYFIFILIVYFCSKEKKIAQFGWLMICSALDSLINLSRLILSYFCLVCNY